MKTEKLYALRTSDTAEWVQWMPLNKVFKVTNCPYVALGAPKGVMIRIQDYAIKDTGHPCEWVEVWVIPAKPVTEEVIMGSNPYKALSDFTFDKIWAKGFRACMNYLGIREGK